MTNENNVKISRDEFIGRFITFIVLAIAKHQGELEKIVSSEGDVN